MRRAISQIAASFLYQSYSDDTLLAAAILAQPTNSPIVPSTLKEAQAGGYSIGLAGFSDTPVAIRLLGSGAESGTFILRPGQSVALPRFESFEYGLPFGWLGGGRAVILVGHDKDVKLDLGPAVRPEIIFHRTRLKIVASANPLPALTYNWPLQFPWTRATRGSDAVDQKGNPILRVQPTRTLLRLQSAIAVAKKVGFIFRGTREFDEDYDGSMPTADLDSTFCEVDFAPSSDPSIGLYPTAALPENFLFLACDEGGITAVGLGDVDLTDVEIDVVRFGRL